MKRTRGFGMHEGLVLAALAGVCFIAAAGRWQKTDTLTKLAQVKTDMRTMAVALEAYYVQNGAYPPTYIISESPAPNISMTQMETMLNRLTTPVAFLSQVPAEPFNNRQGWLLYEGWDAAAAGGPPPDRATRKTLYWLVAYPQNFPEALIPFMVIGYSQMGITLSPEDVRYVFSKQWTLMSPGPDGFYWFDVDLAISPFYAGANGVLINLPRFDRVYDPTNGLASQGDIARTHAAALPSPPPFNSAKSWDDYR